MSSRPLSGLLGLQAGETVAAVGCGGKTSLLLALGEEWRSRGVLLSTTTKLEQRETDGCDAVYTSPGQWAAARQGPGVWAAGIPAGKKLAAPPPAELDALRRRYSLTLLECDGSRRLPLKGWREDEPVIPPYTDHTIGIAVLWPLGGRLDEQIAFQPRLFAQISGATLGDRLEPRHLAAAIAHPRGLFHHARGARVLCFNQVEDDTALAAVSSVVALLPAPFLRTIDIVAACSLHKKRYIRL